MNSILEVAGLHKQIGSFRLEDVSFSLQEGCITGLVGINGAGKTTTIKAILGLVPADAGNIALFGKDIAAYERELKNRIGIVMDEGYFYEDLTLQEMKSIIAQAYSQWDEAAFKQYLSRFNLQPRQKISTLSKGMRMKYALALALSHQAELLIMDEPTSGLDPLVRSELMDILLDFMQSGGKSVFFSTHITSDLDKVADALIFMDKGRIRFVEDKDALLDSHAVVKGDKTALNEETRTLFLSLDETHYGFTGLTGHKMAVRQKMNNVLIERPTIEDVMLGYLKGAK
ncbi:ABC transporter ATP-binding protein [Paenibacillus thiaminolyticus]|uniref:ABC transporter ATP-binding protein n=1 Tax=Paenibacillus thiaminolyticus TaxID=49283 RepID=A0AAP9DT45_PANTH|nr:ABC transporter ATP-binding protein [Paenibacillus thiaminolyticus]MCY9538137.1 ABC transporter ATP-binding protein [Paenibacillus thiaminolyticus]MCY9600938.1 ABC transporter ATP-binding protein [Paenibacillus thiaminolyticus]MCY9609383.1 ABC transporter ATP-binding protein [Paenibacillus thiaminolyticus]MCY9614623.1 ABC transporter ATP-binding protein [Paenibacillus thiaminolyticus]MCY9617758.1 ABC transporter ATP-binding protein [Paenibacillus thiaminolyticus]